MSRASRLSYGSHCFVAVRKEVQATRQTAENWRFPPSFYCTVMPTLCPKDGCYCPSKFRQIFAPLLIDHYSGKLLHSDDSTDICSTNSGSPLLAHLPSFLAIIAKPGHGCRRLAAVFPLVCCSQRAIYFVCGNVARSANSGLSFCRASFLAFNCHTSLVFCEACKALFLDQEI